MKFFTIVLFCSLFMGSLTVSPIEAADIPINPKMQVKSGLYLDAKEAYLFLSENPHALLVDVRDPIEIMFTGFSDEVDIHVPLMIADPSKKHPKKPVYAMVRNPEFSRDVLMKLSAFKATKNTPILFICRSGGTRSAPAADLLYDQGYQNVYTIVDGFEGVKSRAAETKGMRNVNGWKNAGLPWSYQLNFETMYLVETP